MMVKMLYPNFTFICFMFAILLGCVHNKCNCVRQYSSKYQCVIVFTSPVTIIQYTKIQCIQHIASTIFISANKNIYTEAAFTIHKIVLPIPCH